MAQFGPSEGGKFVGIQLMGNCLYLPKDDGRIEVRDSQRLVLIRTVSTGIRIHRLRAVNERIFVILDNTFGRLFLFDASSGKMLKERKLKEPAKELTLDGAQVHTLARFGTHIDSFELDELRPVTEENNGTSSSSIDTDQPNCNFISSDGFGNLLVSCGRSVVKMSKKGNVLRCFTAPEGVNYSALFVSQSGRLLILNKAQRILYLVDKDSDAPIALLHHCDGAVGSGSLWIWTHFAIDQQNGTLFILEYISNRVEMEMELREFLSDGTRPDVQLSALKLLLSLSPNSDFWGANSDALIDDLLRLFGTDRSDSLPLLLAILINISAHSLQIAEKLTDSASLIKRCLQLQLSNATKCVSAVQLLSNLSRFCPKPLFEQISKHDTHFLDRVFENVNTNELPETFFGFLLLNLSTVPSAGHEIVNKNIAKLVALLGQKVPKERRNSALNILFNLSMFDDLHEPLLCDPDSLLSALLWPLIDADDRLDEEETALLPLQLQYWEGRRDNTAESGDKVLRTLYQFCATRHGRQCLRRKGIYALMRELDRATTPRNTHKSTTIEEGRICTIIDDDEGGAEEGTGLNGHGQVLRALIGMLIRSEEDIGVTDESIRHFGSDDRQMGKEAAETERSADR
ncbi:hypothetical protein niasHT_007414 [Heterodera trifolii]|uniref:Protein HGH1 homolog n=1 Tax=Heterodera trifolii TaxID=157864 RepID=A0ABD2LLR4_9BILA